MRITFIFALFLAFALASCQQEGKRLKTANGYEYILHTDMKGDLPKPGEYVYFHAQMRNGDSVLYSSRAQENPPSLQIPLAAANPDRRPSPVEDILSVMRVGDSATVVINIDTLPQKPRGFEDASEILYDVVLLEIQSESDYQAELLEQQAEQQAKAQELQARQEEVAALVAQTLDAYKAGTLDNLQETDSGLKYVIHEAGTGAQAEAGKAVSVNYYGALTDGTMFDNSFSRGQPISFPLGQGRVIPGWDEGIALLKEGAKASLFIPYELAYGEAGSPPTIPPKSELLFYVELVEVR